MSGVKLYSYFRSSASWRVRIALNWKGIEYEYAPVGLLTNEQYSPTYGEVNPMHAVPTLEIDGLRLAESMAILEYLEETRPTPPLLPKTPAERAVVRRLAEGFNSGTQPLQNLRVLRRIESQFGADAAAQKQWAAHFITEILGGLERIVATTHGQCCVGDQVTFADVLLVPQMLGGRRFGVDLTQFPVLSHVEGYLNALPAFAAARPERQPDAPPEA
jgi:maleylacetoacetate isomerase